MYSNTGLVNSSYSALVTVSSNLLLVTFHSNTSSTRVLSVGWWNFSTSSFFFLISSSRVHSEMCNDYSEILHWQGIGLLKRERCLKTLLMMERLLQILLTTKINLNALKQNK